MFAALEKSWEGVKITFQSFSLIWKNKKLIIFPVLSAIINFSIFISIFSFIFKFLHINYETVSKITQKVKEAQGETIKLNNEESTLLYKFILFSIIALIIFNLIRLTISTMFQFSQTKSIREALENKKIKIINNLVFGIKKIFTAISWAFVSFIVSIIIGIFRGGKKEDSKTTQAVFQSIKSFFVGIIETGWNLATFFVIPIITFENLGIISSIKKSYKMLKGKLGESIGAYISLEIINFIIFFTFIIPISLSIWGLYSNYLGAKTAYTIILSTVIISFILGTIKSIALNTFKCIIYLQVTKNNMNFPIK